MQDAGWSQVINHAVPAAAHIQHIYFYPQTGHIHTPSHTQDAACQQVLSGLQSAQQQLMSVSALLLKEEDPCSCPTLAAARAADTALRATQAAVSFESLACVAVLREMEVGCSFS